MGIPLPTGRRATGNQGSGFRPGCPEPVRAAVGRRSGTRLTSPGVE
ncbi:phage DNA packaging protein J [Streptomyces sp. NPDC047024]